MTTSTFVRRLGVVAAMAVGVLLGGVPGARAQEADRWETIVVPQRRVLLPPEIEGAVRIESVDASAVIEDRSARTTLAIVLANPSSRAQEAQVLLPVPTDAAVVRFRLEGLPNEGEAKMLPREEARRIYEEIVRRTRDPGLVEFAGLGLIRSSVFPVPAGSTQRVELEYEQLLASDGGMIEYMLPRSESLESSTIHWTMSALVRGGDGQIAAVYSPSHDLQTERLGDGSVRVRVPEARASVPGAFRLSIVRSRGSDPAGSFAAYPGARAGGGYVLFLMSPGAMGRERPALKREVTIVIDRSGSMEGEKIEQARRAAAQIIGALDDGESFTIIDYSESVERFAPAPVVKSEQSVARAKEYLAGLRAVGGTNIHDALVEALRARPAEGVLPLVLFLTDGLPTVGIKGETDIREAARRANEHGRRVFSFGVGYDVNTPLLTALATGSRGAPTFVLPNEDIEVKVGQVFRRLRGPMLTSPELVVRTEQSLHLVNPPIRDVLPGVLPDVFEGDQVVVLARYLGENPLVFQVRAGDASGDTRTYEFRFDPKEASTRCAYVPRLWAARKIGALIDEIRQSGADGREPSKELVDEVVRLSTEWGILTEYTAFLAAEENEFFGAAPPPAEGLDLPTARLRAMHSLRERAVGERKGAGSVTQDTNAQSLSGSQTLNLRNELGYVGEGGDVGATAFVSVRQVADRAMYRRGDRWVDAALLANEKDPPEQTIEFGGEEYFALVDRLASEGRQALLSVPGDVYLMLDGQRTLVRQTP